MRDNGPYRRIRVSSSSDEGVTWSPVTSSELLNPGAGIEAIRLASGRWAMIYNDTTKGRHSLALSLSDDEGQTWKWTRHVALAEPGTRSFHYPSIIQAADGSIHVSYTHGGQAEGSSIDHARFNEAWVLQGDEAQRPRLERRKPSGARHSCPSPPRDALDVGQDPPRQLSSVKRPGRHHRQEQEGSLPDTPDVPIRLNVLCHLRAVVDPNPVWPS